MTAPKSFIKRRFLTFTVAFEIVFSIAFLILYKPLSNTFWLALSPRGTFIRTALFYLSVLALTIVSKVLLGAVEKRMELSVTQLLAHLLSLPAQGYVPYGACVFGCALRVLPFRHLLVHDGVHGCRQ